MFKKKVSTTEACAQKVLIKGVWKLIEIKIFGATPPCTKCKKAFETAQKVAQKFSGQVEVEKFDALSSEGNKYGVMLTPTTVVNDKVVAVGRILSEGKLETIIKSESEG